MSVKLPVRKAVIPAAGLGTRFLPATKAVPKELLPIVDTPTIHFIVEEVHAAGMDTLVLITSRGKDSIIDYFDFNYELEDKLKKDGKLDLAEKVHSASGLVQVVSIRQEHPRGLGHAVLCSRIAIGDEPFAVLLGDDMVDSEVPCIKQMVDVYEKYGKSVVALMEVSEKDVSKFGVVGGKRISDRIVELDQMVEKPKAEDAPSRLAIVGRYILTPRIFEILSGTKPGKGGEIQLTDAMAQLMREEGFIGLRFEGDRYDAGDKVGFLKANIAYGLKKPDVAPELVDFMRHLLEFRK